MYFTPIGCLDSGSWSICNGTEYWSPQPPPLVHVIGDASTYAVEWWSGVCSSTSVIAAEWAGGEAPVATVVCAALALTLLTLLHLWFSHGETLREGDEQEEAELEVEIRKRNASSSDTTIEDEGAENYHTASE